MPWPSLQPLPLESVRHRCRTGFGVRRTAEDLPPFSLLRKAVRDVALGRSGQAPGHRAKWHDSGSGRGGPRFVNNPRQW